MHFDTYVNGGPQLLVGNGPAVEMGQNRGLEYRSKDMCKVIYIHTYIYVYMWYLYNWPINIITYISSRSNGVACHKKTFLRKIMSNTLAGV